MQSVQIPEKEEFRRYLEKAGVVDALTNGLRDCFYFCYYFFF